MLYRSEEEGYRRKSNRMDEQENALENIKKAHEDLGAILEDKYNSFLERNPKAEKHQIERALLAEALWWEEKLDSRMKDG